MRSIAGQGPHPAKQPGSMEEPEIKPCPFCGSVGKLEEESEDGYRFDMYCTNVQYCGGTTSRCRSAAKAIEFWNRRFPG
jgi:Restriction alleviation protein Lar